MYSTVVCVYVVCVLSFKASWGTVVAIAVVFAVIRWPQGWTGFGGACSEYWLSSQLHWGQWPVSYVFPHILSGKGTKPNPYYAPPHSGRSFCGIQSRDTVMQTAEAIWIRENTDMDTAPAPATCWSSRLHNSKPLSWQTGNVCLEPSPQSFPYC